MTSLTMMPSISSTSLSVSPSAGRPPHGSYLKSYPYLFVRETDQTDYFCTLCDAYLKEDDLQGHLFEGHQAQNIEHFFVKVNSEAGGGSTSNTGKFNNNQQLYICVVCWAKIHDLHDTHNHRKSCKVDPAEEDLENGSVPMNSSKNGNSKSNLSTSVVSTPDIGSLVENNANMNRINGTLNNNGFLPDQPVKRGRKRLSPSNFGSTIFQPPPCVQCSLCSMVIPIQGQHVHLRDFHKITCSLDDISCPLCMTEMSVIDLSTHLAAIHNAAPQSVVNAILFWVLSFKKDNPSSKLNNGFQSAPPLDHHQHSKLNHLLTAPLKAVTSNNNINNNSLTTSKLDPPPPMLSSGNSNFNQIPTVLQSLLSKSASRPNTAEGIQSSNFAAVENIVSKLTRCHSIADGKDSIQCLICSKWFAVPPVKHLRGHMVSFIEEKRRIVSLINGSHVCIICYDLFDTLPSANQHLYHSHEIMEAVQPTTSEPSPTTESNDIPTVIDTQFYNSQHQSVTGQQKGKKVELDNAGRVKSGKVRKQCELCGEWSNIKWFFKHMSEVHQALFCRCCREYLPIHEHEEHKHWHSEPPYMGQKIRIEQGEPVIIDRKERASLTPIGSLASWGGSSGGKVVKAVDTGPSPNKTKKRKSNTALNNDAKLLNMNEMVGHMDSNNDRATNPVVKDTLMPKETCPVCGILITYKNLARHIKLRHKIKYKFCHKCRKLVPNTTYLEHRNSCNEIVIDGEPMEDFNEEDEDSNIEKDVMDPTDYLDASSPITIDANEASFSGDMMEDSNGSMANNDSRKSEEFRANTSKNKLESLLGKEFKHPRRRCVICGYTVSYSNFKRHLRNAHPAQYKESETTGDFRSALVTLSDEVDENDQMFVGHPMDSDSDENVVNNANFVECTKCGDQILKDYMPKHLSMNHGGNNDSSDDNKLVIEEKRECPECHELMDSNCILQHCKDKHQTSYKYCGHCLKYVVKKEFKVHLKSHDHDPNFASGEDDVDDESDDKKKNKGCFNCPECNHIFLAKVIFENHMKEVHKKDQESN